MNITKQIQPHRYRENGYQWGEGSEKGARQGGGKIKKYKVLCIKWVRYKDNNVKHREYNQYFIITLNGIQSIKSQCCIPGTNVTLSIYYTLVQK